MLPRITSLFLFAALTAGQLYAAEFLPLGFVLPTGDQPASQAHDVSEDGSVVVGHTSVTAGTEAFRWVRGVGMETLGEVAGGDHSSIARGVSADGRIVAGVTRTVDNNSNPIQEGFTWSVESGIQLIPHPSFATDFYHYDVFDISGDGSTVVGWGQFDLWDDMFYYRPNDGVNFVPSAPFFLTRPDAISVDGSVIYAYGFNFGNQQEVIFRWSEEDGITVFPEVPIDVYGASSDAKYLVGYGSNPPGAPSGATREAFLWSEAEGVRYLGTLSNSSNSTRGNDVTIDGSIVVGESGNQPFIWDEANGMRPLVDYLINDLDLGDELSGWTLREVTAITDNGQFIVGNGTNPAGLSEAWIAQIPEPGSLLLALLGAITMGAHVTMKRTHAPMS